MNEKELREHADCIICGKPIGHTGLPAFLTVEIKNWSVNLDAVQRQTGLAMMLGSARIAQAMGADEEMATLVDSTELTLCWECAASHLTTAADMSLVNKGE
jgi:hypothetical protein